MTSKDNHKPPAPPVKGFPGQKQSPSPSAAQPPRPGTPPSPPPRPGPPPPRPVTPNPTGGASRDPVLGTVDPLRRETETLPVEAHPGPDRDEPVGHARHAETPEEVEKIAAMEGFGSDKSDRKVPPPGSRHYVAGQPVDDEEWERTENEANRLAEAGRAQRTEAEKRMAANNPGDPDYHPADPDHRDPQAGGKRADTNPDPHYDKDEGGNTDKLHKR